ncbi:hypothetical protein B0H16DRAFT_1466398 [Mycena metata]|uniref:Uncharacterized protein n=1 Tax=Mycena metata TaxID=1033252 RepID=A0AAD7I9W5_9AGAR|nr:hypothetical protein B0H16DRAFT_1466398 [Mycena metata]
MARAREAPWSLSLSLGRNGIRGACRLQSQRVLGAGGSSRSSPLVYPPPSGSTPATPPGSDRNCTGFPQCPAALVERWRSSKSPAICARPSLQPQAHNGRARNRPLRRRMMCGVALVGSSSCPPVNALHVASLRRRPRPPVLHHVESTSRTPADPATSGGFFLPPAANRLPVEILPNRQEALANMSLHGVLRDPSTYDRFAVANFARQTPYHAGGGFFLPTVSVSPLFPRIAYTKFSRCKCKLLDGTHQNVLIIWRLGYRPHPNRKLALPTPQHGAFGPMNLLT